MTWYFLIALVLMADGKAGGVPPMPFHTLTACNEAGAAFAAQVRADDTVKQGVWHCAAIDFDVLDTIPQGGTPPRHIPQKGEV